MYTNKVNCVKQTDRQTNNQTVTFCLYSTLVKAFVKAMELIHASRPPILKSLNIKRLDYFSRIISNVSYAKRLDTFGKKTKCGKEAGHTFYNYLHNPEYKNIFNEK